MSAALDGKNISGITLFSEKGALARLVDLWPGKAARVTRLKDNQPVSASSRGEVTEFPTASGERYSIEPATL